MKVEISVVDSQGKSYYYYAVQPYVKGFREPSSYIVRKNSCSVFNLELGSGYDELLVDYRDAPAPIVYLGRQGTLKEAEWLRVVIKKTVKHRSGVVYSEIEEWRR